MGKMTEYEGWDNDKLMTQHSKILTEIAKALKNTDVKPNDLWDLLEMERELALREGK